MAQESNSLFSQKLESVSKFRFWANQTWSRHRAGVRPYTSSCDLAESCVFGKQSLPLFLCNPSMLRMYILHTDRHTFSRSYSANLPSSLTRGLSSALEFSSGPPVSVCGTSAYIIHQRGFSWKLSISEFPRLKAALHRISDLRDNVCHCRVLSSHPTCLNRLPIIRLT